LDQPDDRRRFVVAFSWPATVTAQWVLVLAAAFAVQLGRRVVFDL